MESCVTFLVWSEDPAAALGKVPFVTGSHSYGAGVTALIAGMWGILWKTRGKLSAAKGTVPGRIPK